jgi:hypothetical protein
MLASAEAERAASAGRDWRVERAGSLRSLNQLAASVALRLWEDFVAERVPESTWVHLEFDPAGRLDVAYRPAPPPTPCRLCGLIGLGDDGLIRATELLQESPERGPADPVR